MNSSAPRHFYQPVVSAVHQSIYPVEIRDGDPVETLIRIIRDGIVVQEKFKVWRLSPLGIELLLETGKPELPVGVALDLELSIYGQQCIYNGIVVADHFQDRGREIVGIRLFFSSITTDNDKDRRQTRRWACNDQFTPTAVSVNPARYNDFIYFRIKDVSAGGLKLTTSLRNKFIVPGMRFECIINFPMVGQIQANIVITNARLALDDGKESLSLGASLLNMDRNISETIGQYLLQFGFGVTPAELQEQKFDVHSMKGLFEFTYVKTEEDYREVLNLRLKAYVHAGKVPDISTPDEMADVFDARSRIIMGRFKGRLVATSRMIFNQVDDQSEQELYVSLPPDRPRRDEAVEITRTCTDPDFRGMDLLLEMFRFIAMSVIQSKRRWIMICATEDMLSLYKRIGFVQTELSYPHPKLNNLQHWVLFGDVPAGLVGRTVHPPVWNIIWQDLTRYLVTYDLFKPSGLDLLRMKIFAFFNPVARFLLMRARRKKMKQRHRLEHSLVFKQKKSV